MWSYRAKGERDVRMRGCYSHSLQSGRYVPDEVRSLQEDTSAGLHTLKSRQSYVYRSNKSHDLDRSMLWFGSR